MRHLARQLEDQQGTVTLVELIATIVLGLLIGAAALTAIDGTRTSAMRTTARQEAVSQLEFALARMTREARQATVVAVQGSGVLDMKTRVRTSPGVSSTLHRVRYECAHGACIRKDCGPVTASGTLVGSDCDGAQEQVLGGVVSGTFTPQLNGVTVAVPPALESPALDFVGIRLRARLDDFGAGRAAAAGLDPVEISGGVELANVAN